MEMRQLYYPVVYPAYANNHNYRLVPGGPCELTSRVAAWAAEHAAAAPRDLPSAAPPGLAFCMNAEYDRSLPASGRSRIINHGVVAVNLRSADDELLRSLQAATANIPGVGAPVLADDSAQEDELIDSLRRAVQCFIIDGKPYAFPEDFAAEDANVLGRTTLGLSPGKVMAVAFPDEGLRQRYHLGTIMQYTRLDTATMELRTLTNQMVFTPEDAPGRMPLTIQIGIPWTEELALRCFRGAVQRHREVAWETAQPVPAMGLVCPLLEPSRWQGAIDGTQPAEISEVEFEATRARYEALNCAFEAWALSHGYTLKPRRAVRGGVMIQVLGPDGQTQVAHALPELARQTVVSAAQGTPDGGRAVLGFTAVVQAESAGQRMSLLEALALASQVHHPLAHAMPTGLQSGVLVVHTRAVLAA